MELLTSPITARILAISMISILAWGCASLHPVAYSSPERSPLAHADAERSLYLEAIEGQPEGLRLRISVDEYLVAGTRLQLFRGTTEQQPHLYQEILVDESLAHSLVGDGIEFLDRAMIANTTYHYSLRTLAPTHDDGLPRQSQRLTLTWRVSPPMPQDVELQVRQGRNVEVRWTQPSGLSAQIYRRDLLDERANNAAHLATVDPSTKGHFTDHDLAPGGAFAYSLVFVEARGGIAQFGPPAGPFYITLPLD